MSAAKTVRGARRGGRKSVRNFYEQALSTAERLDLPEAQAVEGLDQEIAVLRVRLKRALQEHPQDIGIIGKGLDLLVKAVAARYRLSPKAKRELSDHLQTAFQHLSETFLPPEGDNHDR
ncbi:MAG: hypothetical protein ACE5KW_05665 [Dehalococcoidia bacterium]